MAPLSLGIFSLLSKPTHRLYKYRQPDILKVWATVLKQNKTQNSENFVYSGDEIQGNLQVRRGSCYSDFLSTSPWMDWFIYDKCHNTNLWSKSGLKN